MGAGKLKSQEIILSIVAAEAKQDLFGVASVSNAPAIGKTVPFTGAFAGAIAVQGYTSPYFGVAGMKMLREGTPAGEMLERVLADDPLRESRQILVIDAAGHKAAFTGGALPQYAGSLEGETYVVGGCGLSGEAVLSGCAGAFEEGQAALADRLLAAVEAGVSAEGGGDSIVSAVLRISRDRPYPWLDLRVDRRSDPVGEIHRLLAQWREQNAPAGA